MEETLRLLDYGGSFKESVTFTEVVVNWEGVNVPLQEREF